MKLNKYFLSIGVASAALVSCTDLDVDVKSQYTEYPDSPIAAELKMADCYYSFRGQLARDYKEGQTCSSDEMTPISFDGDYAETRYTHAYFHNYDPNDPSIGVWNDLASGITMCNKVITEIGGDEGKDPVVAPLRAIRAFYHFVLMDCYGDVPIAERNLDDDEEMVRSPRAQVAKWIESELLEVIPQLSDVNDRSTYGRPNKWMAEALLAKLYINWAVYTAADVTAYEPSNANEKLNDCVKVIDEITASGLFEVGNGYRKKFLPDNGVHIKDFIYAMEYDPATVGGHDYARYLTFRQVGKCTPTSYYGFNVSKSVGGNLAVTPEFADLFCLQGDERNKVIIGGPVFCMDPVTYEYTNEPCCYEGQQLVFKREITTKTANDPDNNVGKNVAGWCMGYKSVKFPPRQEDYDKWNRNQTNDIPIFRYADMLLLKAEAILRGATATNGDTPAGLINKVRDCSGAEHIAGTVTLQDVLDERGRELFNENWRRNDLIRYGKFEGEWGTKTRTNPNAKFDKTKRIYPVPQGVMNTNVNWKQNAGY